MGRFLWVVVWLAFVSSAVAQTNTGATAAPASAPAPPAGYEGVTPGGAHPPPRATASAKGPVLLTWPGFQSLPDGSTRFFVQLTSAVTPDVRAGTTEVVVRLKGVKVPLKNNQHPLVTEYFNTPVRRAKVERHGKDAAFVLSLRAPATPTVTTEAGPSGYSFVFVTFPSGSYRAQTSKAQSSTIVRSTDERGAAQGTGPATTPMPGAPGQAPPSKSGRPASDTEVPPAMQR